MHAVCQMAHAKTDGYLCHFTDGIRRERVNLFIAVYWLQQSDLYSGCITLCIPFQINNWLLLRVWWSQQASRIWQKKSYSVSSRGTVPQTKIEQVYVPSQNYQHCSEFYNVNILKQIVWETQKWREQVYFRSQILERPSVVEYWSIFGVPVLPENVIFTFFRTCWCYSKAYNTGTQKWSSIVQYSCTSIWDLKYTFSSINQEPLGLLIL